jgi:hypothetical protein
MPSIWRTPVPMTFVDPDNRELVTVDDADLVPRAGDNVRIAGVPHVVERIGYDIPGKSVERIWVVCRPV